MPFDLMLRSVGIFVLMIIAGAGLLVLITGVLQPSWRWKKAIMMFLTAVAWLGLIVMLAGTYPSFLMSLEAFPRGLEGNFYGPFGDMGGLAFAMAFFFGSIGTLLALIGGLIARPRYLWVGLIAVGTIYMVSFFGLISVQLHDKSMSILDGVWALLPGVVSIVEGIIINHLRKRQPLRSF